MSWFTLATDAGKNLKMGGKARRDISQLSREGFKNVTEQRRALCQCRGNESTRLQPSLRTLNAAAGGHIAVPPAGEQRILGRVSFWIKGDAPLTQVERTPLPPAAGSQGLINESVITLLQCVEAAGNVPPQQAHAQGRISALHHRACHPS